MPVEDQFGLWTYLTNVLDWTGSGEITKTGQKLGHTSLASGHVSFSHKYLLERYLHTYIPIGILGLLAPANEMIWGLGTGDGIGAN
jgi:hypothetical protein